MAPERSCSKNLAHLLIPNERLWEIARLWHPSLRQGLPYGPAVEEKRSTDRAVWGDGMETMMRMAAPHIAE
jgi:hypothetical protein